MPMNRFANLHVAGGEDLFGQFVVSQTAIRPGLACQGDQPPRFPFRICYKFLIGESMELLWKRFLPGVHELLVGGIIAAFAAIPSFQVGTDFVPNDMLAMIHRGEAIIPASENARGGGSGEVIKVELDGDKLLFFIDRARNRQSRTAR